MVNISEAFPSKYLKSQDLQGEVVRVKVKDVLVEEIGTDRKMVMYFVGKEKGMVLNKTNAVTIGDAYGEDTDAWVGQPVELFSMKVEFNGRMVDGLRVRVPKRVGAQQAPARQQYDNGFDSENPAPPASRQQQRDPLDQDVPF